MSRIVIAAPRSGSGKTMFCMGLMAALVKRGLTVQPCKAGPDYIDTAYHARICGRPACNLDGWLMGRDVLRHVFANRAAGAGIAVIEGVMGLYDGMGDTAELSTADLAKWLETPVLLVVDAGGMAASAAALVKGFQSYDPDVCIEGVVFNNVGGEGHYNLLRRAVERDCGVRCHGFLPHARDAEIESRHLGILPEAELADAGARIERLARLTGEHIDIDGLLKLAAAAPPMPAGQAPEYEQIPCCVAVAWDKAFNFYYEDGLSVLEAMGARLLRFSPLRDAALPACDGIYIGGGFPEVFAAELEANAAMRRVIAAASASGMPIYAECGGYMYLTEAIINKDGKRYEMCGALPGEAVMGDRLSRQFGYVEVAQRVATPLGPAGLTYRAHEFHHSAITGGQAVQTVRKAASGAEWPGGTLARNTLGSYAHAHFAGEPRLAASFLSACRAFAQARAEV
jgi:cobyrinic acid a,c-diamide synthase